MTTAQSELTSPYLDFWRGEPPGPVDSGVFAYPCLEACPQPAAGSSNSRECVQITTPSPSSSSSTSRPTFHFSPYWLDPAAAMRQGHAQPQAWQWYYYDPTRHPPLSSSQLHPTPLASSTAMPGPPLPPLPPVTSPSGITSPITPTANSPTDAHMLDPISASLKSLQSQFMAFQQDLGSVKSDVKDALSQLHTMRTAQNTTVKYIAELQDAVGVSATGARPRGRAKRGRGRGRGGIPGITTESPLEMGDAEVGTVPEKTLVQSVASIQSAIEALLRASHSHIPMIHQEASLPPTLPPFVNNFPGNASIRTPESSHLQSVVHPSQQNLTLQRTQSAFAAESSLPTESSSPFSSIAIPTLEFTTLSQPPPPEKKYADVSIQACLPSPTPTSRSHGLAPGFTPVEWSVDPVMFGRFASNTVQPSAAESSARDNHLPSAPNAITDTQVMRDSHRPLRSLTASDTHLSTCTTSPLSSGPSEPAVNNSSSQPAQPSILPTVPTSSDNFVVPTPGDIIPVTETTPSPSRISDRSSVLQTPILTTESVKTSMESSQMESPVDSQVLVTCPLSSVRDPAMPVSGALGSEEHIGSPVQSHAGLDMEDAQMTLDAEGDAILVTSAAKTAGGSTPTVSKHRRQSPPFDADEEGLRSGLPTPPSETVVDERESWVVSRPTNGHSAARDLKQILDARLPETLPVIPTPQFLTPEPSMGEGLGVVSSTGSGGSFGVLSDLPSPLTPSLHSPFSAAGSSFVEEGAIDGGGQTPAHEVVEEHTNSSGDASVAVVDRDEGAGEVSADAPMDEANLDPRTDQAGVEVSTFEMPVITLTNESRSIAVSDDEASQIPWVAGDVDPSRVPRSPVGQSNVALPERDPSVSVRDVDLTYSPIINGNGYDFHFSSPLRRLSPPTPSTPSRYATPSEPSDSRPTRDHDEDEVWHALMLGGSGVSTPLSGSASLPMLLSHQPSRASSVHPNSLSSQPLSIDPSVLHLHSPEPRLASSYQVSNGSLSPLTSLGDSDVDKDKNSDADHDAARASKTHVHVDTSKSRGRSRGCRSEPCHNPSTFTARAPEESGSVVGAASEVDAGVGDSLARRAESARPVGGPSASVDQLALLARRDPLKICLRIPEAMKGVKRKRNDVDGNEEGQDQGVETVREDGRSVDKDTQVGQRGGVFLGVVPPVQIGATPAPGTRTPTPTASRLAPKSPTGHPLAVDAVEHPDVPIPRKRKKRQSEGGEKGVHAARVVSEVSEKLQPPRIRMVTSDLPTPRRRTKKESERRQIKPQHAPNAKPKSSEKHHVRNGQIVAVASEPEPRSQVPATPSASQPEKANQDAQTPTRTRHRKRQGDRAIKVELSSPGKLSQPSSRSARLVKSSPSKEDVLNAISRSGGTWPELPSVFSNWDIQVCF
ncbi:hypothetical protein L210DRAFT_2240098 [Boletus edulis BED1]|uniref:Uncharacterized protein n=1 Tax=Boletus edulis BED1 TaxID=1328754 RepID=A0AAD4BT35_BOLED|nr:hypothetical protein L210DRAFT_2240098 [Boletus edulis BED1]